MALNVFKMDKRCNLDSQECTPSLLGENEGRGNLFRSHLALAALDYQKYINSTRKDRKKKFLDAEELIFGDDRKDLWSFANICEAFCIEPSYFLRLLLLTTEERKMDHLKDADSQRYFMVARSQDIVTTRRR